MYQDSITEGTGKKFVLFSCMFPTVVMHLPFVSFFSGNTSQSFQPYIQWKPVFVKISLTAGLYGLKFLVWHMDCLTLDILLNESERLFDMPTPLSVLW